MRYFNSKYYSRSFIIGLNIAHEIHLKLNFTIINKLQKEKRKVLTQSFLSLSVTFFLFRQRYPKAFNHRFCRVRYERDQSKQRTTKNCGASSRPDVTVVAYRTRRGTLRDFTLSPRTPPRPASPPPLPFLSPDSDWLKKAIEVVTRAFTGNLMPAHKTKLLIKKF